MSRCCWSWSHKGIQWKRRSRRLRHGITHVTSLSHGFQHVPIKFIPDVVIRWFLNHWLRDIYGVPTILIFCKTLSFQGGFDGCVKTSGGTRGFSFLESWMGIKEILWIVIDRFPRADWCHRYQQGETSKTTRGGRRRTPGSHNFQTWRTWRRSMFFFATATR